MGHRIELLVERIVRNRSLAGEGRILTARTTVGTGVMPRGIVGCRLKMGP